MFTFKNFYIENIKVGNVVELRNKTKWIVVSISDDLDIQLFNFVDSFSSSFTIKLEHYWNEGFDIVGIYKIKNDCPISQIFDDQNLLLLWSRIDKMKVTKKEIEQMLGYQSDIHGPF